MQNKENIVLGKTSGDFVVTMPQVLITGLKSSYNIYRIKLFRKSLEQVAR